MPKQMLVKLHYMEIWTGWDNTALEPGTNVFMTNGRQREKGGGSERNALAIVSDGYLLCLHNIPLEEIKRSLIDVSNRERKIEQVASSGCLSSRT